MIGLEATKCPSVLSYFANQIIRSMLVIRYSTIVLFLAVSSMVDAQSITLVDPGNTPVVGSSFLMHTGAYSSPLAGGADQLFDLSGLSETSTKTYTWALPSISPIASQYPGADLALVNGGLDTLFYSTGTDGIERVGESQSFSLLGTAYQVIVPYTDGILELEFPLTYEDTWTDAITASFSVDGTPAVRTGTITGEADGWGRLVMPGAQDTLEVLRVHTVVSETNTITPINIQHSRSIYAYYPLWGKFPVLRTVVDSLTSIIQDQGYSFTEWLDASALGVAMVDADAFGLQVRPNPANDFMEVVFNGGRNGAVVMDVVDMRGASILHHEWSATSQQDMIQRVDVRQLDAGIYQVLLTAADGTRSTKRFVVTH